MALYLNGNKLQYGAGGQNYSTDERIVGTWIDGSPIYEKSYFSDNIQYPTANVYKPLLNIPDIDRVISIEGVVTNSAHTNYRNLTSMSGLNNSLSSWLIFDKATTYGAAYTLYFSSQDTWATGELFVTIRYTKSST